MTDYNKLVKALRICSSELNCGDCPLLYRDSCSSDELMNDAADAIEAMQAQMPKRGEIVRCGECKYSSKPDTNGEIWCKREDHGEDLMECHGVGWFCADGEREVHE